MTTTHGKKGSGGSATLTLPASPTLTNPDMILPDYDDPTDSPERSRSPLTMWKTSPIHHLDLGPQAYPSGPIGPLTPATPIIYGNGTMLSDIGEVTEVESVYGGMHTPGPMRSPERDDGYGPSSRPSPTAVYEAIKKKQQEQLRLLNLDRENRETRESWERERRASIGSTSTVTNGDGAGLFADFDETMSVDDSVFQGDDEESNAEPYTYNNGMTAAPPKTRKRVNNLDGTEGDGSYDGGRRDRYDPHRDSTALSRRAEKILANAKRRLTTMEGNLTRARSSLSVGSGSTPSPPIVRPATAALAHNRMTSGMNVAADFKAGVIYVPRSSSALGESGGYRQPLQMSRSADYIRENMDNGSSNRNGNGSSQNQSPRSLFHDARHALEPLSEDEGVPSMTSDDDYLRPDSALSSSENPYKRPSSATQVRDLKDQMMDLKGRLSNLRDQARADSLRRLSSKNLRDPNPFTHAQTDQWDIGSERRDNNRKQDEDLQSAGGTSPISASHHVSADRGERWHGETGSDRIREQYATYPSVGSWAPTSSVGLQSPAFIVPAAALVTVEQAEQAVQYEEVQDDGDDGDGDGDGDDMRTEDGHSDENEDEDDNQDQNQNQNHNEDESQEPTDDFDDCVSDSGESSYHDTVQHQVSHEDREDAFDYENFFLHSAMGSLSRGRRDSIGSDDSVETTRGPAVAQHNRRDSTASVSTIESFATATEGRLTKASQRPIDEDHDGVFSLPAGSPQPRSPDSDSFSPTSLPVKNRSSTGSIVQSFQSASSQYRSLNSAATASHRPSISSMESIGTVRSFPLVNRPKPAGGLLTPRESPDRELKQIAESLLSETASICHRDADSDQTPMQSLSTTDQALVENVVASLGRCVLALTEAGGMGTDSDEFRGKIEKARRILEGVEGWEG